MKHPKKALCRQTLPPNRPLKLAWNLLELIVTVAAELQLTAPPPGLPVETDPADVLLRKSELLIVALTDPAV